jgi:DNA-binding NarL/FixJ family response regulator
MGVEGSPKAVIGVAVVGGERLSREGLVAALQRDTGLAPRDAGAGPLDEASARDDEVLVLLASPRDAIGQTPAIRARRGRPPLVLVSVFEDRADIVACIDAGFLACVSSDGGIEPLVEAIRSADGGIGYLCPRVADVMCRPAAAPMTSIPRPSLSEREHDVLRLVAQGLRSAQIATLRNLSIKTVHTHRQNLMAKLGVRGSAQMVFRAMSLGLLDP